MGDTRHCKILDHEEIPAGASGSLGGALDLLGYQFLSLHPTVHVAGDGEAPTLVLKHAAVDEEDAYVDFETRAETALTNTGAAWHHADSFGRYVRPFVEGTLSTGATVSLDVIAKG